jgi:hypothetical protein
MKRAMPCRCQISPGKQRFIANYEDYGKKIIDFMSDGVSMIEMVYISNT